MKKIALILFALMFGTPAQAGVTCSLPFNIQNGTTADATQVMANYNALVTCLTNAAAAGVNNDITALTALSTPLTPAQGGSSVYYSASASGGTANAQTVASVVPNSFSLATGKRIVFVAGATNTGPMTLNVNSTGATNVFYPTPSGPLALTGGEVKSGNIVEAYYDGTQYQLITNNLAVLGPLTNVAAAATTDLGTVATHNVNITSAATISSFGSSASTAYPLYFLTFVGVNTLTYNASSMILPGAADIATAAGDFAIAQYLGSGNWKIVSYQRASGATVVATTPLCGTSGLKITNNGVTPNSIINITANQVVMQNTTGVTITRSSVSVTTLSILSGNVTSTANGMDGEAPGTSAWIYIFLIDNGTTTAGLASLAAGNGLSPTMPSGYTYKCRVGAMRVDSGGNLLRTLQYRNRAQYIVGTSPTTLVNIASGAQGTYSTTAPTWAGPTISTVVPPTATVLHAVAANTFGGGAAAEVYVAPNTSYAGRASSNPPPIYLNAGTGMDQAFSLVLESSNIAVVSSATGGFIGASGWDDNL